MFKLIIYIICETSFHFSGKYQTFYTFLLNIKSKLSNIVENVPVMSGNQAYHYSDVIMNAMTSQITGVSIVCSSVCSGADQREHQSSASLAFVRGVHRQSVDSPHKGPVTRKMFPYDDVIIKYTCTLLYEIPDYADAAKWSVATKYLSQVVSYLIFRFSSNKSSQ